LNGLNIPTIPNEPPKKQIQICVAWFVLLSDWELKIFTSKRNLLITWLLILQLFTCKQILSIGKC